ncbi:hypothetical protein MSAN_00678800 [Mycena sanguinolenta]|uniref:DUF6534 domain-containing protein n=1 Tax=Mycena sanguinolenta TaxID=230812 RepID=A0A8H6Z0M4_9AGAR|nr:hypothetical protein MSAN_00678800 [Mycena sanguinolenta]
MATTGSVIELVPASAAFVDNRTNSLGSWVLSAFVDSILMGVVFCQIGTFFKAEGSREGLGRHYRWLVVLVLGLSILKTSQAITIVWVQNVQDFTNPDVARLLLTTVWWQVSAPFLTGIIGVVVQSFFALRFYMLVRNIFFVLPIIATMLAGFAAICLQMNSILVGNAEAKVMWLLVHLVCAFVTDLGNTVGTCYGLHTRNSSGLASTASLINRLLRLVFESAIPPTVVAAIDLVMTQTLDAEHLLWHLLLNFALAKLYVISLMYTLNSINEYRQSALSGERVTTSGSRGVHRGDVELGNVRSGSKVYVHTQTVTHISPSQGTVETEERAVAEVKLSGWQPDWNK